MADEPRPPETNTAAGIQADLIAGKFKTQADLVHAYGELERKLGEMGASNKQIHDQLALIQQNAAAYAQAYQQAKPLAEWAQTYGPQIHQFLTQYAAQQQQAYAAQQQAYAPTEILRPEERQRYAQEWSQYHWQNQFMPWLNQFLQTQAIPYMNQMVEQRAQQLSAQNKAGIEVLWDALSNSVPPEALDKVRRRQELAVKFSDPRQYDPMKFAEEAYARDLELTKAKERDLELTKQIESLTRSTAPGAAVNGAGGVSPFRKDGDAPAPKDRHERAKAVIADVKDKVGVEAWRESFPPAGGSG